MNKEVKLHPLGTLYIDLNCDYCKGNGLINRPDLQNDNNKIKILCSCVRHF